MLTIYVFYSYIFPYYSGDPANKIEMSIEAIPTYSEWSSRTCSADAAIISVLANTCKQGQDLECVDVNPSRNLVAVGTNSSCLNLYRYPCANIGVR